MYREKEIQNRGYKTMAQGKTKGKQHSEWKDGGNAFKRERPKGFSRGKQKQKQKR